MGFVLLGRTTGGWNDTSLPRFAELWLCSYGSRPAGGAKSSVQPGLQVMRSENPELQSNFLPLLRTGGLHGMGLSS